VITDAASRNNAPKTRGRPFVKGNPGRPKGARHRVTLLAEKLMQADVKAIVEAVVKAARNGDMTAARIVLDRIAPARRDSTVRFDLPKIESIDNIAPAMGAVLAAVASGEISPNEGQAIAALLGQQRQAFETAELAQRLDEPLPDDDAGVIRVEIVGNPEHTRQIAKAAEDAALRRCADDRE
jgi:hypothetical protein